MTAPVRIRLSRRRGFDLAAHSLQINGLGVVNCARPGPFGNPFVVGVDGSRIECVQLFRVMLGGYLAVTSGPSIDVQRQARNVILGRFDELRGKNLACWCPLDACCHVDVLLEMANR